MKTVLDKNIKLDPGFWTKTSQIQLFYGLWVNLCHLGIGLAFALPSVQVPQLSAGDSFIKITRSEASWIASVFTLFSPIGCLISGYITDWLGRRVMIIVCQAPICVGWLYTGFAKSPKQLIIGRAITGIGSGMAMTPPRIFTTEISLPNMRGVIGCFSALAISTGISIQAGLGQFLPWPVICHICSLYTFTNFVSFFFLPETPYFVLKTKSVAEAGVALTHFRAQNYNFDKEMDELKEYKQEMGIRKITARERLSLLFTRSSCKPFSLIVVFLFFTQITGTSSVLIWAVEMLTKSNSSIDAHTGNFLMSLTRLIMIVLTSIMLFKVGRRPLALISALGVAVICMAIATYLYYYKEPSMVPLLLFMSYMAFASIGYFTLPFLMASELYPLQNRGLLGGITTTFASLLIFSSLKLTPYLLDSIGLIYTMVIFGISSLFGVIFVFFFLPETKDLTLQEIEEYYSHLRPTLVSQRKNLSKLEAQSNTSNKIKDNKKKIKAVKSSEVLDLARTIFKLDAQKKPNRSRQDIKSTSRVNSNAGNQDVPKINVDTILLQKVISLAKTIKSRKHKSSKENSEESKDTNKRPSETALVIGKSKLEDITEVTKSSEKVDTSEIPGTSKELESKSSKTNFVEKGKLSTKAEHEKIKEQSDDTIQSRGSKKSNQDKEKTNESKKDAE